MSKIFISSDHHFNHSKIIQYCKRPYETVEQMNESLIVNWNSKINKNDTIYYLGDFGFGNYEILLNIFNKLNGNKILAGIGNHDRESFKLPWKSIHHVYNLRYNGYEIHLSHYPHRSWPKSFHGALHFFGHAHGGMPDFGRSTDVGIDCWNYFPTEIDKIIDKIKNGDIVDHHGRE